MLADGFIEKMRRCRLRFNSWSRYRRGKGWTRH
jgi:hypothetical protein